MSNYKQFDNIKSSFRKRNYKAFFFFLVFTLLIWSFVQLSKTYKHTVQIAFELKEIPESIIIDQKTKTLPAEIQQTGFKILSVNLFNSHIDLNFRELDSLSEYYNYSLKKNKSKILKSLKLSNDELEIGQDSLKFDFYKLSSKKLEVKHDFQITFDKGYDSINDFTFQPAYIEVFGNDSVLKTLEFISTEPMNFKNVMDTLSGVVNIKKSDSISNKYSQEKVRYSLPVAKFTEGTFDIPISFENDTLEDKLVIFPKTVKVNFKTSLFNYERIDESGFKVVAKYNPEEDFMLLELVKQPKLVKNVSIENNKVDYLIKK